MKTDIPPFSSGFQQRYCDATVFAPFQEIHIDWVNHDAPAPVIEPEGYPFRVERDASSLPRHKMNLIFPACGQADALLERGFTAEARRLLYEAALLEPEATIV